MKKTISKRVIYLLGLPGVGKTTVGSVVARKTGFALLDNHLTYREVCNFLNPGTKEAHLLNGQLHMAILKMLLHSKIQGVVCTLSIRRHPTTKTCQRAVRMAEHLGAHVNFVKIKCDWQEHKRRVQLPSRRKFTKTNTVKKLKEKMAIPVFEGLSRYKPFLINNTKLSPEESADKIISALKLK